MCGPSRTGWRFACCPVAPTFVNWGFFPLKGARWMPWSQLWSRFLGQRAIGSSADNATVEAFHVTLKRDTLHGHGLKRRPEASPHGRGTFHPIGHGMKPARPRRHGR
jgi:hypothetical protein